MIDIIRTDSSNSDFKQLVSLLDEELRIRDGADNTFYAQFNKIDRIKNTVVAYHNKTPVACGAFKFYADKIVEIKRMFVLKDYRSKGNAQKVLDALEQWAVELGFDTCILETGKRQPEAIRLYEKARYLRIPNYGQYKNIDNSVCMEKKL